MGLYDSWGFKRSLEMDTTVSGSDVSGTNTDFIILVRITATEMDFSQADTNGEDVRFTNDAEDTDLFFQILRWDSGASLAEVMVRVTVPGNAKTDIKMHWGKSGQTTKSDPNNTFKTADGFEAVWHMNESSGAAIDSTANANNGTYNGDLPRPVNFVIGKGQQFDATGDNLDVAAAEADLDDAVGTFSVWFNRNFPNSPGNNKVLISFRLDSRNNIELFYSNFNNDWRAKYKANNNQDFVSRTNAQVPQNTNQHWLMTWDTGAADEVELYHNGVSVGTVSGLDTFEGAVITATIGDQSEDLNGKWDGEIQEVRMTNVVRNADWAKLLFQNTQPTDTLITFGAVIPNVDNKALSGGFGLNLNGSMQ